MIFISFLFYGVDPGFDQNVVLYFSDTDKQVIKVGIVTLYIYIYEKDIMNGQFTFFQFLEYIN